MGDKGFTYIVDIEDLNATWWKFEKRTRYDINKCRQEVGVVKNIKGFDKLHKETRPDRKIDYNYIDRVWKERSPNICMYATPTAMAIVSWDAEQGYYLLAARKPNSSDGSPSKILWQVMRDLNKKGVTKFNMCGANELSIEFFKRGFGGEKVEQQNYCLEY